VLDAEGTECAPTDGERAFAESPEFDEADGPEDEEGRVDGGVGEPEQVEEDTEDGDEHEGLSVGGEEGEVESYCFAKLEGMLVLVLISEQFR
jgi:hypothetical protein